MGDAIDLLRTTWDRVTNDFLAGEPTNIRAPLDRYFSSYRRTHEVQLSGFCEPYHGPLDRTPKMVFLSLNPGELQPSWQERTWNGGDGGIFVKEILEAGSYSRWAAGWPYLQPHWQEYIKKRRGANHHLVRLHFMQAWHGDDGLKPDDRLDFELYPWHSHKFHAKALKLDFDLIDRFIWQPLGELQTPIVFAFGSWWWTNLEKLGVEVVARLGYGSDRLLDIGYKPGARQGLIVAVAPHGGLIVAEKHGGPPPGPPRRDLVPRFREQIIDALPPGLRKDQAVGR